MTNRAKFVLFLYLQLVIGALGIGISIAQDSAHTRQTIDTLCSPHMHGRGYVNNGEKIAAEFISSEFQNFGLKSFLFETYHQPFPVPVNTILKTSVTLNKTILTAGKDYLVSANSPAVKKGNYKVVYFNKETVESETAYEKFKKENLAGAFIFIDKSGITDSVNLKKMDAMKLNPLSAKGIIFVSEKLTHSVANKLSDFPAIEILPSVLPAEPVKKISVEIENKFFEKYFTQNIIGYVEGTQYPDSFIVFSAHYDHLGRMGADCYFPGANDNASGTAMLLNLAKYFSEHPQKRSVAFIAFGAEEAGLLGSKYFTLHPLFPLEKIRFLVNLDIVGTGDEGITVVNATEHPAAFETLKKINTEKKLLSEIKERGKAQNSDHYWFSEKGVPAFFIYTLGGIKAYHDIYDKPETLPLTKFDDVCRLLISFSEELQR